MAAAADHDFERPYRPEGYEGNEALVLANQADFLLVLQMDVITQ